MVNTFRMIYEENNNKKGFFCILLENYNYN